MPPKKPVRSSIKKTVSPKKKEEKKKVEKKVKIEEPESESDEEVDDESNLEIGCIQCNKRLNIEKDDIYDYCVDCNTLMKQCSIKNIASVLTAVDNQLKQLYNDNYLYQEKLRLQETANKLLQDKIKILEVSKTSQ